MRVTVADCLDLDAFRGAEVVAGKINLTNDVKAVSGLDACDSADLKFYKPDKTEILLTGFLGRYRQAVRADPCGFKTRMRRTGGLLCGTCHVETG